MEKANRKQTIVSSKPLGVTAWIFLENIALKLLKTVSMYWRAGLLKNSSHSTFHSSWAVVRYPACSKKPRTSAVVTADSAAAIASTRASLVLAAALRKRFFILAKASSMGL